jgi:hypothetical protein
LCDSSKQEEKLLDETYLVNTSPTNIKKKVGETKGAKITCLIAIHRGFLIFHGKIKHFTAYNIRKRG